MTKSELRKIYKAKRVGLSDAEIENRSLQIANQTLKLPIWKKSVYHVFLSIEKHKEVNTEFLMHILSGKDKNITIAKSNFSTYEMTHYLLTDNTKLVVNSWGIPEPENGLEIPADKIDVVFVPLLAFDLKGNRTGYGKGFYDRFLSNCRKDTIKVGLSFFETEKSAIEHNANDIKLDFCVTPERIYEF